MMEKIKAKKEEWIEIVAKYQKPDFAKAIWQVINTGIPFIFLWAAMYYAYQYSYWAMLPIAMISSGFFVRLFIIQHDCGHNSFFPSKKANNILGSLLGAITLTPYVYWRKMHAIHHAGSGNLDFRGIGDIEVLTIEEYQAKDWKGKLLYRFYRHPFVMFVLGPPFVFFILQRIPVKTKKSWKRERSSVHFTNVSIVIMVLLLSWLMGLSNFLPIWLTMMFLSTMAGVWLFYVQHQFEDTYWRRKSNWDYKLAALEGSSFYKLPKILQWFSGNIGYHHIHHLAPGIPNYMLEKAHKENKLFQDVKTFTILSSLKTMFLNLWDEENGKLVPFSYLKKMNPQSISNLDL
jgi:acyl-lipid omega-6 desaturase (Delta-12 desaturase)